MKVAAAIVGIGNDICDVRRIEAAWQRHGITADRVLARNAHIAAGSATLWDFAQTLVRDAVTAGHLAPAAKK